MSTNYSTSISIIQFFCYKCGISVYAKRSECYFFRFPEPQRRSPPQNPSAEPSRFPNETVSPVYFHCLLYIISGIPHQTPE